MLMYTHISTPKCQIGTFYFIVFILFLDVGVLGHILRPIRKNTPVKLCQHFTDKSHYLQLQSALNPTNKSSPQFLLKPLCTSTDSIHIKTTLLFLKHQRKPWQTSSYHSYQHVLLSAGVFWITSFSSGDITYCCWRWWLSVNRLRLKVLRSLHKTSQYCFIGT